MAVSRPPQSGDESEFTVYGLAVAHQQTPCLAGKCGLGPSPPPMVTDRDLLAAIKTTVMSLSAP
jgi:hypothetical protein